MDRESGHLSTVSRPPRLRLPAGCYCPAPSPRHSSSGLPWHTCALWYWRRQAVSLPGAVYSCRGLWCQVNQDEVWGGVSGDSHSVQKIKLKTKEKETNKPNQTNKKTSVQCTISTQYTVSTVDTVLTVQHTVLWGSTSVSPDGVQVGISIRLPAPTMTSHRGGHVTQAGQSE